MLLGYVIIFGVCELGDQLTCTFEEIEHVCDQFKWYLFPRNVKHMLPILIMAVRKPVELNVFGTISCSRITLENVSETSVNFL